MKESERIGVEKQPFYLKKQKMIWVEFGSMVKLKFGLVQIFTEPVCPASQEICQGTS